MPRLQITANVTQEESTAVQREFSMRGKWTVNSENYNSPNGASVLVLESRDEVAFGPKIFSASITTGNNKSIELSNKSGKHRFLSPGRYGRGYDHWDGDPWSPDSSKVALFDFLQREPGSLGGGSLLNVSTREWTRFADGPGVWSHHMWSPTGDHYLFRDLKNWYILNATTGQSRHLAAVNRYPCHAYFLSADHVLILEDSSKVLSVETLEVLTEEKHRDAELYTSDRYSLYDPDGNRVLLGVGVSIGEIVTCRKWYAIAIVERD